MKVLQRRPTVAIDVSKFKKLLKDKGTNMTQLEKELDLPISKYVRYGKMPRHACSKITLHFEVDYATFVDHREELISDLSERIKDLERLIQLQRNQNRLLTQDNERLADIVYSYEMLYAEEVSE